MERCGHCETGYDDVMTEPTPNLGKGTDIDADELDVEAPVDPPASSDAEAFRDEGDGAGGTGGLNAGGAG